MLHHRVTDIVAQGIRIPQVVVQQPLHPLRTQGSVVLTIGRE
jgi:hypothetical protein